VLCVHTLSKAINLNFRDGTEVKAGLRRATQSDDNLSRIMNAIIGLPAEIIEPSIFGRERSTDHC
jgi:hypothetical protein